MYFPWSLLWRSSEENYWDKSLHKRQSCDADGPVLSWWLSWWLSWLVDGFTMTCRYGLTMACSHTRCLLQKEHTRLGEVPDCGWLLVASIHLLWTDKYFAKQIVHWIKRTFLSFKFAENTTMTWWMRMVYARAQNYLRTRWQPNKNSRPLCPSESTQIGLSDAIGLSGTTNRWMMDDRWMRERE